MTTVIQLSYGEALRAGFYYLLKNHPDVFVIGQGLWSPWYVGNTMNDLDNIFGSDRIIDTPVSESAVTAMALGAALAGKKPIVVHPRMDFMLYAMDAIVNQAAKWRHMTGAKYTVPLTIRAIINRGGEQGAQHSQALHSWFVHVPGLRVVMPASAKDARDLFVASVLSPDPVVFIDDRWLYDSIEEVDEQVSLLDLDLEGPKVVKTGDDITIVAAGYSVLLALEAAEFLSRRGIKAEVVDVRVLSTLKTEELIKSVKKTRRLLCVDGGWGPCGFGAEILTSVLENISVSCLLCSPQRITLPFAPAPTSSALEGTYYTKAEDISNLIQKMVIKDDEISV